MILLDASCVLALLYGEDGHERIAELLTSPCGIPRTCSSEVLARIMRDGASLEDARSDLGELELTELPFDAAVSQLTAQLEARTRGTGTSFVDRSCIATGIVHDAIVVTADRSWAQLDLPEADIRVVR